jgi:hypothetical protein
MSWAEILAAYPFLQPIIDTLKPVIGDAYHLLLSGIRAKQKARELLTMTNAMVEAQGSAPHASVVYQEDKWSITMPGQKPSDLSLPPASEMQFKLAQRRYEALAGTVAEAAIGLQNETNFPQERPSGDWVARYVEFASQVKDDQKMQEFWGRLLAGEIKKPGSFSFRTLEVVSNLAQHEAKFFENFAKHVVVWKWFAVIPVIRDNEFLESRGIGDLTLRFLAESGLAAETQAGFNLVMPDDEYTMFDYGRNRGILVRQKSPPVTVPQHCWTLTRVGVELLSLIEREANPEYMQILVNILRRFG